MNEHAVYVNGARKNFSLIDDKAIIIDDKEYFYELLPLADNSSILKVDNKFYEISAELKENGNIVLSIEGKVYETYVRSALQEKADQIIKQKGGAKRKTEIKAPMPGMVLKINKSAGEKITKDETILILEAMKMENDLRAPHNGIIKDIFIKEGTAVEKGTVLFSIE